MKLCLETVWYLHSGWIDGARWQNPKTGAPSRWLCRRCGSPDRDPTLYNTRNTLEVELSRMHVSLSAMSMWPVRPQRPDVLSQLSFLYATKAPECASSAIYQVCTLSDHSAHRQLQTHLTHHIVCSLRPLRSVRPAFGRVGRRYNVAHWTQPLVSPASTAYVSPYHVRSLPTEAAWVNVNIL